MIAAVILDAAAMDFAATAQIACRSRRTFSRRARDSYWHYHHVVTGQIAFSFLSLGHRSKGRSLSGRDRMGCFRFLRAQAACAPGRGQAVGKNSPGRSYFLFPLQLTGDYQIRAHSPFGSMHYSRSITSLESFARHAPDGCVLLVKEHPLDQRLSAIGGAFCGGMRNSGGIGLSDRVLAYRRWRTLLDQLSAAGGLGHGVRQLAPPVHWRWKAERR